jgi:hypothetical protein
MTGSGVGEDLVTFSQPLENRGAQHGTLVSGMNALAVDDEYTGMIRIDRVLEKPGKSRLCVREGQSMEIQSTLTGDQPAPEFFQDRPLDAHDPELRGLGFPEIRLAEPSLEGGLKDLVLGLPTMPGVGLRFGGCGFFGDPVCRLNPGPSHRLTETQTFFRSRGQRGIAPAHRGHTDRWKSTGGDCIAGSGFLPCGSC